MVIVLLTVIAHAQGMGRSQKGELKKEHQAKKKEDQEKRRRLRTHTPFIAAFLALGHGRRQLLWF
jgi:hypothetical protein